MTTVLERILARTREHVQERKRNFPLDRLQMVAATPTGRRGFAAALGRTRRPDCGEGPSSLAVARSPSDVMPECRRPCAGATGLR